MPTASNGGIAGKIVEVDNQDGGRCFHKKCSLVWGMAN